MLISNMWWSTRKRWYLNEIVVPQRGGHSFSVDSWITCLHAKNLLILWVRNYMHKKWGNGNEVYSLFFMLVSFVPSHGVDRYHFTAIHKAAGFWSMAGVGQVGIIDLSCQIVQILISGRTLHLVAKQYFYHYL